MKMDQVVPSILADTDILKELIRGNIVINPYDKNNLQNCSYDVRMGEYYYRSTRKDGLLNPWAADHIKGYWGSARLASIATMENAAEYGLKPGDKYIEIEPFETILAHTNEFIGGRNNIVAKMQTRSSIMRSGLSCCKCAGWGDIGYINRWTMEITNHTAVKMIIPVGKRVAQIIFHSSGTPSKTYGGKYQSYTDINTLIANWKPESMLPMIYLDTD